MKAPYEDIISSEELDELIANYVYSKYNYQTLKLVRKASKLLIKNPNSTLSQELAVTIPNKATKADIAIASDRYKNAKALMKAFFKANVDKFTFDAIKKITGKKYFDTFFLIADALANNSFDANSDASVSAKPSKAKKEKSTSTAKSTATKKSATSIVKSTHSKSKDIIIIKGIGKVIAEILKSNGYESFEKISTADPVVLKDLIVAKGGSRMSFSDTSTWAAQAKLVLDNDIKGLQAFQKKMG